MVVAYIHEAVFQHWMPSVWWDLSIFHCRPCHLIGAFRRADLSMAMESWVQILSSLAFVLNGSCITLRGSWNPILRSTTSEFPWGADTPPPPPVLTNALSTAPLEFTQHCECRKQREKEFTFILIPYQLVVTPDTRNSPAFQTNWTLFIMYCTSQLHIPKVLSEA